jgi:hypothetical protein
MAAVRKYDSINLDEETTVEMLTVKDRAYLGLLVHTVEKLEDVAKSMALVLRKFGSDPSYARAASLWLLEHAAEIELR